MARPLIVSDCDEVLLHMVAHFRDWLGETHDIAFDYRGGDFGKSMTRRESGEFIEMADMWALLSSFFDSEMHRQHPIAGAPEALAKLGEYADVVVLTNLEDKRREERAQQLLNYGIDVPVYTNQGPKGRALAEIVRHYQPIHTVFIDDLASHLHSASAAVPNSTRLQLCGEPAIAPHVSCAHKAGYAHARIDTWDEALPWIEKQIGTET